MIAAKHREEPASVRIFALFNVLDPGSKRPERHLVLRLAGDSARVAPDAFAMVYDKAVFHLTMRIAETLESVSSILEMFALRLEQVAIAAVQRIE